MVRMAHGAGSQVSMSLNPGDRVLLPKSLGEHRGRIKWRAADEFAISFTYPAEDGSDASGLIYLKKGEVHAEDQMPLV
jgi:hypothetical protein